MPSAESAAITSGDAPIPLNDVDLWKNVPLSESRSRTTGKGSGLLGATAREREAAAIPVPSGAEETVPPWASDDELAVAEEDGSACEKGGEDDVPASAPLSLPDLLPEPSPMRWAPLPPLEVNPFDLPPLPDPLPPILPSGVFFLFSSVPSPQSSLHEDEGPPELPLPMAASPGVAKVLTQPLRPSNRSEVVGQVNGKLKLRLGKLHECTGA